MFKFKIKQFSQFALMRKLYSDLSEQSSFNRGKFNVKGERQYCITATLGSLTVIERFNQVNEICISN